jgi:hypothetical protein
MGGSLPSSMLTRPGIYGDGLVGNTCLQFFCNLCQVRPIPERTEMRRVWYGVI